MASLQISQLSKKFGDLAVLSELELEISSPGVFAVLGPNGSGKTTLIKILLGLVVPDQGQILLNQKSILGQWQYRDSVNYLPQIANFPPNLSVRELLQMVREMRTQPCRQTELIGLFGLDSFLDKKLGKLSGGTKQKVNLVLTFMFDCQFLILDEPTNGLDPIALIQLKELIEREKSQGKIILITTHIMSLVEEIADEILFLLDGKTHFRGNWKSLLCETGQPTLERAIAHLMTREPCSKS